MLTTGSPSPITTNRSSSGPKPISDGVVPDPVPLPLRYSAIHAPSASSSESRSPVHTTRWVWSTELT